MIENKKEHCGIVEAVYDSEVKIRVESHDLIIPYAKINKAVQIVQEGKNDGK